jgi:AbrB family looped-hinge helix DNA binding protein
MTAFAKVSPKGQATIPKEVRAILKVEPGDLLAWEITGDGRVEVHRAQPADREYLRALEGTLSEWADPADEEAYHAL